MPKWLSRTLIILLALVVLGGALVGAFYLGQQAGASNALGSGSQQADPRLDRDRIKPSLRDDGSYLMPWSPMDGHMIPSTRFPVIGFILGALWALVRLALLVLLVWIIVRLVLRANHPAPPAPPPPPPPPPTAPPRQSKPTFAQGGSVTRPLSPASHRIANTSN